MGTDNRTGSGEGAGVLGSENTPGVEAMADKNRQRGGEGCLDESVDVGKTLSEYGAARESKGDDDGALSAYYLALKVKNNFTIQNHRREGVVFSQLNLSMCVVVI